MGEDYYAILEENPLIVDTLSRAAFLAHNESLLHTVYNIPWLTTVLWSAAAGSVVILQPTVAQTTGQVMHYGSEHVKSWNEVNRFMDSAAGVGYRLRFGHSIEYLSKSCQQRRPRGWCPLVSPVCWGLWQ